MTERTFANDEQPAERNRVVGCGALSDNVTKAVEILSVHHGIPGSLGYRLLVQTARDSHMSVREAAAFIVNSKG